MSEHVAGDEVDDGFEVSFGSVALGLALGGLDVAVDGLQDAIGKAGGDRSEDALRLGHDRLGQLLHRREVADLNPGVPAVEETASRFGAHRETKGQLEKIGVLHPLRLFDAIPPSDHPTRLQIPTYPLLSARSHFVY